MADLHFIDATLRPEPTTPQGGTPDARYCYQCKDATAHPMSKGMRELLCLFTDAATPRIAFETFFNAVGSVQGRLQCAITSEIGHLRSNLYVVPPSNHSRRRE